jgi:hypothetical protein
MGPGVELDESAARRMFCALAAFRICFASLSRPPSVMEELLLAVARVHHLYRRSNAGLTQRESIERVMSGLLAGQCEDTMTGQRIR